MSNTFDIWPLLVKWGSVFKNLIIIYISVNVGRSDLILDMEVNVYRYHMSHAKLKYLYKQKYRSIGSGVSPVELYM